MSRIRRMLLCLLLTGMMLSVAAADEGMWMPESVGSLPQELLCGYGLELTPRQIFDPAGNALANAMVRLNGASASFVSADGLIITNHHVAHSALHEISSAECNFLRDGLVARSRQEEAPAKNFEAWVLLRTTEVTDRVLARTAEIDDPLVRMKQIEKNQKAILSEAEKQAHTQNEIKSIFDGKQYYLYTYLKLKDIRLVFAPPESIGAYGGDTDNWMWPRHTGDFAFLRAYTAPDGTPADYAPENVPYHPQRYLTVSLAGVREGDFTMIMGYPYRTQRYLSSYALADQAEFYYPWRVKTYGQLIKSVEQEQRRDEATRLKLGHLLMRLQNGNKKSVGVLEGLRRGRMVAQRRAQEQAALKAMKSDRSAQRDYQKTLATLNRLYEREYPTFREKFVNMDWMFWYCDLMDFASTVYEWSGQKALPNDERELNMRDHYVDYHRRRLQGAQHNFDPPTDKEILRIFLRKMLALSGEQRVRALDEMLGFKAAAQPDDMRLDAFIDKLYAHSGLVDEEQRMRMFESDRETLLARRDPAIEFVAALWPEWEELKTKNKAFAGETTRVQPRYIEGLLRADAGPHYPDANGSLRFSFGRVQGYSPRDGVLYTPFTTLRGMLAKHTGVEPFDAPAALRIAAKKQNFGVYFDKRLGDVPVDFLSTNDGTGGNSGSPILNGKGELIGLIFDTDYEAVASDFGYLPQVGRAINVDIRYVLFVTERVYGAKWVVNELTIQ
ncbi:MAG TPA: S46 family peptidase [bacterium]|nr:S46 family peptidase [bacterium]